MVFCREGRQRSGQEMAKVPSKDKRGTHAGSIFYICGQFFDGIFSFLHHLLFNVWVTVLYLKCLIHAQFKTLPVRARGLHVAALLLWHCCVQLQEVFDTGILGRINNSHGYGMKQLRLHLVPC